MNRTVAVSIAGAWLLLAGPSWGRVGVTSATTGDPLGQPPAEHERILRVGIDVQANERVTTKAADRAHLVFLDGTSLSVGPDSTLVLDKFVYDPDAKQGELNLSAAKGVFRLVGGNISKTGEITINTPSASIGVRGGIATFEVTAAGTTANFLYGRSLTVKSQGETQTASREGSTIHVEAGHAPEPAVIIPPHGHLVGNVIEKPATPDAGTLKVEDKTQAGPSIHVSEAQIEAALDKSELIKSNSKSSPTGLTEAVAKGGKPANSTAPKLTILKGFRLAHNTIAVETAKQGNTRTNNGNNGNHR